MFQIEIPTFLASAAMPGDRRMPQWWKKLAFIDKQTQTEQLGVQKATQMEQLLTCSQLLGVQKATQTVRGAVGKATQTDGYARWSC